MGSKFYVELDEKSLSAWFRKQAKDYIKGITKEDIKDIISEIAKENLKGKRFLNIVRQCIRELLPTEKEKMARSGLEKTVLNKNYIEKLVREEIIERIKNSMPNITIKIDDALGELFK